MGVPDALFQDFFGAAKKSKLLNPYLRVGMGVAEGGWWGMGVPDALF